MKIWFWVWTHFIIFAFGSRAILDILEKRRTVKPVVTPRRPINYSDLNIFPVFEDFSRVFNFSKILHYFPTYRVFNGTTHAVDEIVGVSNSMDISVLNLDLAVDKYPCPDHYFDFAVCDSLHYQSYPVSIIKELKRIAKNGLIITPSPLSETLPHFDRLVYRGFAHSRWIMWTNSTTNTLRVIPKHTLTNYNLLHYFGNRMIEPEYLALSNILEAQPAYFYNYYSWYDESISDIYPHRRKPFAVEGVRHDIHYNILSGGEDGYEGTLYGAAIESVKSTEEFFYELI